MFEANEYFDNEILTKEYDLKCDADLDDPWSYDGIAIIKGKGFVFPIIVRFFHFNACFARNSCKIDWKKGKNVTEKTVTKKQKHKSKGQVRTVTKTVKNDSFFNFFDPPEGMRQLIC